MMRLPFHKSVRWLTLFLAGFCVALITAVWSLPQVATATSSIYPQGVEPSVHTAQPQFSAPVNQFAQEVIDSHRAPNFYQ
ncbi:hypothetical protein ACKFKG_21230 [Phormidesmis sp. 146-35]